MSLLFFLAASKALGVIQAAGWQAVLRAGKEEVLADGCGGTKTD
jgi:hypothetical protein